MPNQQLTLSASRALFKASEALGSHVWFGEQFCHYTDLNGLKGIVEANEFWLSDHRFLNDPSEHSYGQKIAIEVIQRAIQEDDNAQFSELLREVLREITDASPVFYVASFSLAQDRLVQWKGYGRTNEGVCLILENDVALRSSGVLTQSPAIEPMKVIYNLQEQTQRLEIVISIFREEFINFPCGASETLSLWRKYFAFLIAFQLILFKHEEYSSEEEIRLVLSAEQAASLDLRPRHRTSNGRLVPYVTTKNRALPAETKLPLKGVIIGPLATQDAVVRSVKVFLSNMGYENVFVLPSSVPFRG